LIALPPAQACRHQVSPGRLVLTDHLQPIEAHDPQGRSRWPSTESLANRWRQPGASMETFVQLIDDPARSSSHGVPMIDLAQAHGQPF